MSQQPTNWDQEWAGLEPKQSRGPNCGIWALLLLFFLLIVCGIGGWLAWQQVDGWLNSGGGGLLPTPEPLSGTETAVPDEPQTPLPFAATVTLPSDVQSSSNVAPRFLAIVPTIDGALTEWDETSSVTSPYLVYTAASWDGSDDIGAEWNLGWDSDNLYVAATVTDDIHVQTQTGPTIFRGDSLSLQFDTDRDGDFGPRLSDDDYQIDLSPGNFGDVPASVVRYRGRASGDIPEMPGHGIVLAAQQTDSGYTLEAAIPWNDLALSPEAGLTIGVALNVNDNDGVGTAVQEVMKSHVATRRFGDPTTWGTLTLE